MNKSVKAFSARIFKQAQWLCSSALIALGLCTGSAQAVSLSWSGPASGSVAIGETFDVVLHFDGLTASQDDTVAAFEFNILYDASTFGFTGGVFGDGNSNPFMLDSTGFSDITDLGGIINAFAMSGNDWPGLDAAQPDSFIGLTLSFVALAANPLASIELDMNNPQIYGTDALEMSLSMPSPFLNLEVTGGAVVGVPESGVLALLGIGLLGLGLFGTRTGRHNPSPYRI